MDRSHWGMLIAVDVQYAERAAVTAAVGFIDWSTPTSTLECVLRAEVTPRTLRARRVLQAGAALPP